MPNIHNERIALYIERRWPQSFSEFCSALRHYPLPISSGAAAAQLHGSCPESIRATEAYCCSVVPQCTWEAWDTGALADEVLPGRPEGVAAVVSRRFVSLAFSPFRCFKMRRVEPFPPPPSGKTVAACNHVSGHLEQPLGSSRVNAVTASTEAPCTACLNEQTVQEERLCMKELRERCADKGLPEGGTKRDLLSRLRRHNAAERTEVSPKPQEPHGSPCDGVPRGLTGPVGSTRIGPTVDEMLRHGQRLRTLVFSPSHRSPSCYPTPTEEPKLQSRVLGTPREFVASRQPQRKRLHSAHGPVTNGAGRAEDGLNEACNKDSCSHYPWHLLVDNRERAKGAHENLMDALSRAGVSALTCTLPCGDFMIGVNSPAAGESPDPSDAQVCHAEAHAHVDVDAVDGVSIPVDKTSYLVVERKTVKDLCASITSSRYYEQRQLLSSSPFRCVVWVVEGTVEALSTEDRRRVYSSCASLSALPRFRVVRTRHLPETIVFLRSLGRSFAATLARLGEGASSQALVTNCSKCLRYVSSLRKSIQAQTTFPRMLMCLRGCSAPLAAQLAAKYGSMLGLWRDLQRRGKNACDEDPDICCLTKPQREVYVYLTEFILSTYYD